MKKKVFLCFTTSETPNSPFPYHIIRSSMHLAHWILAYEGTGIEDLKCFMF